MTNVIPKSELERLTSDPGVMFTQIRLIPVVEGGQTKGFRFDWIADGSLFQKMGINVGDILVSINNQPINSGEDAFRILQIIRNERSFKVAIVRNGQPVELTYTVD
ncbi:MAG: PDZ domain-containing protein [Hydrogenothermaceae bacterium]